MLSKEKKKNKKNKDKKLTKRQETEEMTGAPTREMRQETEEMTGAPRARVRTMVEAAVPDVTDDELETFRLLGAAFLESSTDHRYNNAARSDVEKFVLKVVAEISMGASPNLLLRSELAMEFQSLRPIISAQNLKTFIEMNKSVDSDEDGDEDNDNDVEVSEEAP